MIETMRFSDTPLWWRLLVLALTLVAGYLLYAGSAWVVTKMSDSLVAVVAISMFVVGLAGTIYTTRRDKRRLANRQNAHRQTDRRRE